MCVCVCVCVSAKTDFMHKSCISQPDFINPPPTSFSLTRLPSMT